MAYSERRVVGAYHYYPTTFYTQQRKTEYKASTQTVSQTQKQEEESLTPEKARQLFEQRLAESEAAARQQAAQDIAAAKEKAWQEFLAELEAKQREYEREQKQKLAQEIARLKREYTQYYPSPAEFGKAYREAMAQYQKVVEEWRTEQMQKAQEQLAQWEKEQWENIEKQIQEQKQKLKSTFETELQKAIQEATPKQAPSLAEQFLSAPDLLSPDIILGRKIYHLYAQPSKPSLVKMFFAGLIATGESIVYGISDIGGMLIEGLGDITGWYKFVYSPFWHPRYPPTVSGALITSGIESALSLQLKGSKEWQELTEEFPKKYGTVETIFYGAGTVAGDILAAYVGSKAFELAKKGVSKVVGEISEATGWKYSHLHYVLHEKKLALLEKLPKSPITSLKQSSLAYRLHEFKSTISHAVLPPKYMKYPAREIVGMPSVLLGKRVPESWLVMAPKLEAAGSVAWSLAATPRAAGFGYTLAADLFKPTSIAKGTAKELAAFGWLKTVAHPKYEPMPSDWILGFKKTPEELAWEKFTYRSTMPSDWILGFEKPKGLSLKDLLKSKKASVVLVSPLEVGKKVLEKSFYIVAPIEERVATTRGISSFALFVGLKSVPNLASHIGAGAKVKPTAATGMKVKTLQAPSVAVSPLAVQIQALKMLQSGKRGAIPRVPILERKGKPLAKPFKSSADVFGLETGVWQYPVATPKQALKFLVMPTQKISKVKRK